jgi:hypothetical protein
MKLVGAFLAGCLVTTTILGGVIENQHYKNGLIQSYFRAKVDELSKQRDSWKAKFDKVTIAQQQPAKAPAQVSTRR